ncbi:MAG: alpha/beta fold hydrolase [Mycobacteriales bacterium]|nr:alpha/beta fold hydrolase [Mycobacteriales bacterium]
MTPPLTTLVLLHGLGATGSAWTPLRAIADWPGEVLAPDLPGHGSADRLGDYSVPSVAKALAAILPDGPLAVLGHSFGGAVGAALAGLRDDVTAVLAVGVKVSWSEDDVARFAALAARPPRVLPTREQALDRHLAMAGLVGRPPEEQADGVAEVDGGWGLAMDPAVLAQRSPDLPGLIAATRARVSLLRGEHDPMVTLADLEACGAPAADLPGLGHNAHAEDPTLLWQTARPLLT